MEINYEQPRDSGTNRSQTHRIRIEPMVPSDPSMQGLKRVYEVWPSVGGRSRFCCKGHCMTGPRMDLWYNVCAWFFIIIPTGLYYVGCAPYLWVHVSKWMPALTGLIFISTVVLLLLTSCTDPGIIPRHILQGAVEGLQQEVSTTLGTRMTPVGQPIAALDPLSLLTPSEESAGYRWCQTCLVVRPPRASHCRDCNNCVLMFDHHCPFANNCIGRRNYMFFSGFLISVLCLGFSVIVGTGICYFKTDLAMNDLALQIVLLLIGAPTVVTLLTVLGLCIFHTCLACRGQTTREVLTRRGGTHSDRTLFAFRGPSLLHGRDIISSPLPV